MQRMERVSSRQNALVKRFRELARARPARTGSPETERAELLLDGEHLLEEALASGVEIEIAAFGDQHVKGLESPLARLAVDVRQHGGRPITVTDQVLAAMSPVQHPSGVVAIGSLAPATLPEIFGGSLRNRTEAAAPAGVPLVPIVAGVQDPGNVGAIIRAAAAFAATGVAVLEGSANPFGWKALRGAMGATFRLPVASGATIEDVVQAARHGRVHVVAAVPRGGTPLHEIDFRRPIAIVLGAEGAGTPAAAIAAAHQTVTIPMLAPVESLNVAIAGALILYEGARQRLKHGESLR